MNFLEAVDELGIRLETVSPEKFSFEAYAQLKEVPFNQMFSRDSLGELRTRHSQNAPRLEHDCIFSDECLVLYLSDHFSIELYHWLYSDTGIHDHHFQGAFQCLEGEDHQIEFAFTSEKEIFEGLDSGKLQEMKHFIIRPGDTQEIRDEDKFIHAVAHAPSTYNLCVRTKGNKKQILKAYHIDGYSYALDRGHEERLNTFDGELHDLSSTDLLHVFYMTKKHSVKQEVDAILKERHSLSYLEITGRTAEYLNQMGRIAKNY